MIKPAEGEEFSVHVIGEVSGDTWSGKFKAKKALTFQDILNQDRIRRNLLGNNSEEAGLVAQNIATALSELAVRLVDSPVWWKESEGGANLADSNVVTEVYKQAKDIETKHIEKIVKAGEAAQKSLREIK